MEPPNPGWIDQFEEESNKLRELLGPCHVAIHHIGSTSIAGIYAKPIIDILIEATHIEAIDDRTPLFEDLGYEAMGEFGLPGRRYFRKDNAQGLRTHHVHSYAHNNNEVHRHLAFRNFMREHSHFAQRYSDLKQQLAHAHPRDINAYMNGKDAFIKDMEQRAIAWMGSQIHDK